MKKLLCLALAILSTSNAQAMDIDSMKVDWLASMSIGSTKFKGMMDSDGSTHIKRLAIGAEVAPSDYLSLGLELGAQDGNAARPNFTQAQLDVLGGPAIQATIKNGVDILLTAGFPFYERFQAKVKAGGMFRQMHFDRDSMNELKKINGELQAGIEGAISKRATLGIYYQGVFAKKMTLTTTGSEPDGSGSINAIPAQHGCLISLTYNLSEE